MEAKSATYPVYTGISQFCNLEELNRRSNSTVLQAICNATGIPVAIKCFQKDALTAKEAVHVAREVHMMGTLRGEPGIVQVLGLFEDDTHAYIVMELCAGGDVYQCMVLEQRSDKRFAAAEVVAPLLRTLHRLHTVHQVVHRDIKPENILLTAGGEIRLADFGTAIKRDVEVPFLPVGTLDFMAPEVLENPVPRGAVESPCTTPAMLREHGMVPYDEKVDIWAVGALAYELMVGQPPFYHEDPQQTRALILGSAVLYIPLHLKGTSFSSFLVAAMARDPHSRPSAAQLLQHEWLEQYLDSTTTAAPPEFAHRVSERPVAPPAASSSGSPLSAAERPGVNLNARVGVSGRHAAGGVAAFQRRLTGRKHGHSESAFALRADVQAAAALDDAGTGSEGSKLSVPSALLTVVHDGNVFAMRRRADSAPVPGMAAGMLTLQHRRSRRLPELLESLRRRANSGSTDPEQHTPSSVLPRSLSWHLPGGDRPVKLNRLSRSSTSPAAGATAREEPRPDLPQGVETSGRKESTAPSTGQLNRIKSYLSHQRGNWSKKFSIGRALSSTSMTSASEHSTHSVAGD